MAYQIFTDTSSGMPKALRKEYGIDYFRMGLNVAGEEKHGDLDYEEFSREQLYAWVKDPNVTITTSLVTAQEFTEKCEKYLDKGIDILYIACTDALSGTRAVFELVKRDLQEKYPERTILSINSCRAEMAGRLRIHIFRYFIHFRRFVREHKEKRICSAYLVLRFDYLQVFIIVCESADADDTEAAEVQFFFDRYGHLFYLF